MTILAIIGWSLAALFFVWAIRVYYELWKWARICQSSRIAIAYKRKVKLQGPLTEWIAWVRLLDKDKDSQGRVVYQMGGTSVAITRADAKLNIRFREFIRIKLATRRQTKQPKRQGSSQAAVGTWSATDQTPKENHIGSVS